MSNMWIRYDAESGTIHSIGGGRDDTLEGSWATIDLFTATEFIDGVKQITDYIAVPVPGDEGTVKIVNTKEEQIDYDIAKSIYQIEKGYYPEGENCVVTQDLDSWTVSLSEKLRSMLKNNDYYEKKVYNFYITEENDPNVLLDKFQIKIGDLIQGDCVIKDIDTDVCQRQDVSVFAFRLFDTYKHVIKI
jgi:hypothetical protein